MKLTLPSFVALLALSLPAAAAPVGNAFTYQGRLDHNGGPANGSYDLKFELFNVAAGGNAVDEVELPAQAVSKGLFSTELDFGGPLIFDGTAYWLAVSAKTAGAADYVAVPGRTAIRPTPYAIHALSAASVKDGSVTSSSLSNGAVTAGKLAPSAVGLGQINTSNAPNPGQILNYDGNNLTWINPTGGGTGPWQLNGTNAFYNAGKVGIGTNLPNHALSLTGTLPGWTSNGWGGALEIKTSSAIGWQANAAGSRFGIGQTNGGLYFFRTASNPGTAASPAVYDMWINDGGNVIMTGGSTGLFSVGAPNGESGHSISRDGNRADIRFNGTSLKLVTAVGTGPPPAASGIEINTAGNVIMTGGSAGTSVFGAPNGESGHSISRAGNRADIRFDGTTLKLMAGPGVGPPGQGIYVNSATGKVGIGASPFPVARLEVVDQDALRLIGYQPFLTLLDSNAGYAMSRIQGADGKLAFHVNDWSSPSGVRNIAVIDTTGLWVNGNITSSGNTSVSSLTIRGGADLAEPFAMSHEGVEPGTVVVIDEKNPGKLKASTRAYDKKVAGIVSGANGIRPGISMIQEDKLEAGENVALSGRVYVKADLSGGSIEPGDLLTTSSNAGRAMKAADHDQAQGAIIGKAMTPLTDADGMVLVLVSLQ